MLTSSILWSTWLGILRVRQRAFAIPVFAIGWAGFHLAGFQQGWRMSFPVVLTLSNPNATIEFKRLSK